MTLAKLNFLSKEKKIYMNMESILGLCGGLALFLYGMHMMSDGLEAVAGERMKQLQDVFPH